MEGMTKDIVILITVFGFGDPEGYVHIERLLQHLPKFARYRGMTKQQLKELIESCHGNTSCFYKVLVHEHLVMVR